MSSTAAPEPVRMPVIITSFDGRSCDGEVTVEALSGGARARRAIAALGFCWLLAIAAVLVPIAHFVLVPGLLLAGPFVAMGAHKAERQVTGGDGACPICRTPLRLKRGAHPEGFSYSCRSCRSLLRVTPRP
jgi:hypothetical protein